MGNRHPDPVPYIAPQWADDAQRPQCYCCHRSFTWYLRRHHCRCCGEILCRWCWGHYVWLPEEYQCRKSVPVCTMCSTLIHGKFTNLLKARTVTLLRRVKRLGCGGSSSPTSVASGSPPVSPLTRHNHSSPSASASRESSPAALTSSTTLHLLRITRWRPLSGRTALSLHWCGGLDPDDVFNADAHGLIRRCSDIVQSEDGATPDGDDADGGIVHIPFEDITKLSLHSAASTGTTLVVETASDVFHIRAILGPVSGAASMASVAGGIRSSWSPMGPETEALYVELKALVNLSRIATTG
eukprot:PhM_4_TR10561/c0_g1_i1/m.2677